MPVEMKISLRKLGVGHEPTRARSAGFPACGFTEHSCPVFLLRATGKSPEPADRNVCPTHPRFMKSPLDFWLAHLNHEPRSAQCRAGVSPAQRALARERESKYAVGFADG